MAGPNITPIAELEKRAILDALNKCNGDKPLAAHHLGIGKTTIYRKLYLYSRQRKRRISR